MADKSSRAVNDDTNDDRLGCVKVYYTEDNGLSWKQLGPNIDREANGDLFRLSLALSEDDKTLAIGSPKGAPGNLGTADRQGYVRVYSRESIVITSSWKQLGQDIHDEADGDVSVSSDDQTLVIEAMASNRNCSIMRGICEGLP